VVEQSQPLQIDGKQSYVLLPIALIIERQQIAGMVNVGPF
jgi:hypothetical protein